MAYPGWSGFATVAALWAVGPARPEDGPVAPFVKAGLTMTKRVSGWRVGFAGLSAWALVVSAGCDQRSESAKAVDNSARDLHALSGASPEPAMDTEKAKTLGKIAADLAPAIASGDAGEKSAASMLVAQTQAGLAEQAMTEAAEAERTASNTITQVNTYLSNWKMRSAAAGAAETFDPSAQRAE